MLMLLPLLTGCWKATIEGLDGGVTFEPVVGAPEGWVVQPIDVPMECPDREDTRAYLLHPEDATGPQPVALFFHSGAFDYVRSPQAADPTAGSHLQDVPRLEFEWGVRKVIATLGMGPDAGGRPEEHDGSLPTAFAEAGISVFLPANCWGDYWHNAPGVTDHENAAATEHFERRGYELAEWSYDVLTNPSFATSQGVALPIQVDANELYLVGQGEGGRAVSELLASGHEAAGAMEDSTADDLRAFYDGNQQVYGATVTGLDRIFPGGKPQTVLGSIGSVTAFPDRYVYLYSTLDSRVPNAAHDWATTRLTNFMGNKAMIEDVEASVHVVTGSDIAKAREAVAHLTGN